MKPKTRSPDVRTLIRQIPAEARDIPEVVIANLRPLARVVAIWRQDDGRPGRWVYLERMYVQEFSVDEVIQRYGGGDYRGKILGEWDPEGCAACSAKNHPENAYRNGELYAAYTAEALKDTLALAKNSGASLVGLVTWSFEFEDQAYFEGFRELATNGIDKPVLNAFRMFGMLGNERVRLTSSAASLSENVLNPGNATIEGINGFATRKEREVVVLVWNYQEEDVAGPSATVSLSILGLPETAKKTKMERFRVDRENSNAYTAWQKMGRPEKPSGTQYAELEAAGKLKMDGSPEWVELDQGKYELRLELPRQGLALVRLTW